MKIEGPIPSCEFCEILSTGEQSLKLEVEGFPSRCNYVEKILSSFCRPNQLSLKLEL